MADEDKLGMQKEWEEPAPKIEEKPPTPPPPPQEFVREIDLGDGGGKQVFRADSYEALVDKFVEAQTNATRKIRELSRQDKRRAEPETRSSDFQELKPSAVKAEELAQFQSNPHELFRRTFQAEVGITPEEFRLRENDRRRQEAEIQAQQQFVQRHAQEYTPTPENAQKIMRFLANENLPVSKRNLDYAFEQLRVELGPKSSTAEIPRPAVDNAKPAQPATMQQVSPPPSFVRPSLGGRVMEEAAGGTDVPSAELARIAQLPPSEMKARIEQIFRQSRTGR